MIVKGLALLVLVWIALAVLAWLFQRKLIYFPMRHPVPSIRSFVATGEDVSFPTEDGIRLDGWFLPSEDGVEGAAMLVFNGNAGDRSFRLPLALALARSGYSVLLFDYRGYGGNGGSPSESGLIADARAARAYLAGRPDVDPDRIVYLGESLGSAVAVGLAAEHPPAALVLRSPFTSLAQLGRHHFPILPVRLLIRDRFASIDRIGSVSCPVLVVAGDADRIVPIGYSRKLFEAARQPKRLAVIPGADHNDAALLDGERFLDEVARFSNEALKSRRGDPG